MAAEAPATVGLRASQMAAVARRATRLVAIPPLRPTTCLPSQADPVPSIPTRIRPHPRVAQPS